MEVIRDEAGNAVEVRLSAQAYNDMVEELEELDAERAYWKAKAAGETPIPFRSQRTADEPTVVRTGGIVIAGRPVSSQVKPGSRSRSGKYSGVSRSTATGTYVKRDSRGRFQSPSATKSGRRKSK